MSVDEMKRRINARNFPGSKQVYGRWLEIPPPKSLRLSLALRALE